jgi:hypothetical protein
LPLHNGQSFPQPRAEPVLVTSEPASIVMNISSVADIANQRSHRAFPRILLPSFPPYCNRFHKNRCAVAAPPSKAAS